MPDMRTICRFATLALLIGAAFPALAAAPQPRRPVDRTHMQGRWYEIARSPRKPTDGCQAGFIDWTPRPGGSFRIRAACQPGGPGAPIRVVTGEAVVLNPGPNTKIRLKVLAGLVQREYWVLDHAADYGWLIMAAPKGGFVAIEAPRPVLVPEARAEALARMKALGLDTSALIFPVQAAR